jgi:DNA-binding NarL/FixJ family response regulator
VLIVDDDAAFRRSICAVLTGRGFDVVGEADTLARAQEAIASLAPDALLLDVTLPDGNGLTFALGLDAGAPRILLTSSDPAAAPARLLARASASFVAKDELLFADLGALLGAS